MRRRSILCPRTFALLVLGVGALLAPVALVAASDDAAHVGAATTRRSFMVEVSGKVVANGDGRLGVLETGAEQPVAFLVDDATRVVRDGDTALLADLRQGDAIRMTVDGRNGRVVALRAEPRRAGLTPSRQDLSWLAPLVLVAGASMVFARARRGAWLIVGQVESLRPRRRLVC